jgi:hypothetical protein
MKFRINYTLPDGSEEERGVVVCLEGKGGRPNGFLKAMEV